MASKERCARYHHLVHQLHDMNMCPSMRDGILRELLWINDQIRSNQAPSKPACTRSSRFNLGLPARGHRTQGVLIREQRTHDPSGGTPIVHTTVTRLGDDPSDVSEWCSSSQITPLAQRLVRIAVIWATLHEGAAVKNDS